MSESFNGGVYKKDDKEIRIDEKGRRYSIDKKGRMVYLEQKIVNVTQKMSSMMNYRFAIDSNEMEKRQKDMLDKRKAVAKRSKDGSLAGSHRDADVKSAGRSLRNNSDTMLPNY